MVSDAAPPTFSIVVPSLNQGRFLESAIRSVLEQKYRGVELIVMDGGSTDETSAVIARYERQLTHWVSRPDRGPADALNRGCAMASGDIIGVLNADDFFLPGALDRVARAFIEHPAADVISGDGYFADADGALAVPAFSDRWNLRQFRYGACVLLQPATFFRRAAFERTGGFRETGRLCWDMELWADLARAGARFEHINSFLAAFRLHEASFTGRAELRRRRVEHARAVLEELRGRPESALDQCLTAFHRVWKFSHHPARTVQQRLYFHETLSRWWL
ncbi:MAG TPA: glycosyltransferase family 2 protein [Vicinamibacterales bacterium]|nr:glycosyltransferase family 2 protein [Vicinamibacterales bacterium]